MKYDWEILQAQCVLSLISNIGEGPLPVGDQGGKQLLNWDRSRVYQLQLIFCILTDISSCM